MGNLFNTLDNKEFLGVKTDFKRARKGSDSYIELNKAMKGTPQYEEWKRKFLEAIRKKEALKFISDNRFFMIGDEAKEVLSFKNGELSYEDAFDKDLEVENEDLTEDIKEVFMVKPKQTSTQKKKSQEKKESSRAENKVIKEELGFKEGTDFTKNYYKDQDLVGLYPNQKDFKGLQIWQRAVSAAMNSKQRFTGSRFANLNDVINIYRKLK